MKIVIPYTRFIWSLVILVECAKIQAYGMPILEQNNDSIPAEAQRQYNAIGTIIHRGW